MSKSERVGMLCIYMCTVAKKSVAKLEASPGFPESTTREPNTSFLLESRCPVA